MKHVMSHTIPLWGGAYLKVETDCETKETIVMSAGLHATSPENALHNAAILGFERLIIGLTNEGVDITTPYFHRGVQAAVEAIGNSF